jgi:dopamine beta-monooxygenase
MPKINQKLHLVQFEVLINKINKQNFHHLLGFECDEEFVPTGPLAKECGEAGVPEDVGQHCMSRLMFVWAIGAEIVYKYPEVAGYPWIPSNKTRYFLLEFHYDNPDLKENIVDDSGVRLYVTPTLRKHDLGAVQLSNSLLQIPPSTESILVPAVCPSECTNAYIPDEGITVLTGVLHTHLVGKSVRTYVVRDGQIVKNLVDNPNYDFNYQFAIDIEPYKLQKGDSLYTECVYSTKNRKKYTSVSQFNCLRVIST